MDIIEQCRANTLEANTLEANTLLVNKLEANTLRVNDSRQSPIFISAPKMTSCIIP